MNRKASWSNPRKGFAARLFRLSKKYDYDKINLDINLKNMSETREFDPQEQIEHRYQRPDFFEDGFDAGGPKPYRYNPDNEALISITRHGEKTPEGELSAKGHEQAAEQGRTREIIGSKVKGYHGPAKRTKQMVETITDVEVGETAVTKDDFEKLNTRMRKQLDYEPLSKAFLEEWKKKGKGAVEWYLSMGPQKFDDESSSADELAERAANLFYRQIRMAGRLNSGSKINLENASHSPTLDVFVARAFQEQIGNDPVNPNGSSTLEKMGGSLKEADNFQIHAKTDENGRLTASLAFRGKEYPVNLALLRQMSEDWIAKQKNEFVK